jgi:hypothetical protein
LKFVEFDVRFHVFGFRKKNDAVRNLLEYC